MTASPFILVTGTSGFLGKAIAEHLRAKGGRVAELRGRADFASNLRSSVTGAATVIHAGFHVGFGASSPAGESENVENTRSLIEAAEAARVGQFVFLNAAGILGVSEIARTRNEDDVGTTDLGFEKYRDTAYIRDKLACTALLNDRSIPVADLLLTTVYGPAMNVAVARPIMQAAAGPNPVVPYPPGGTSYLHLVDFLAALDCVLERKSAGRYVLSSGNTGYRALFETACRLKGTRWRKTFVPVPDRASTAIDWAERFLPDLGSAVAATAFGFKYYSSERARRDLGWTPERSLEDCVRDAL